MTRGTVLALCCTGFLSVPVFAGDEPKTPACCAKKAATATAAKAGKLRCSITGKVVDKCCCEKRDGELYCTLAKKSVEKCCCSEVKAEEKEAKRS
jgi:hypothetical protein